MDNFEKLSIDIEELKYDISFRTASDGIDPFAEQHFLAALAHLELAAREMMLAHYYQMQGRVKNGS